MRKMSNSELYDKLVKTASTVKNEPKPDFIKQMEEAIKASSQKKTLREVLAQGIMPNDPAPEPEPLGDSVTETEQPVDVPGDAVGEDAKQLMAKAFLALHGGDMDAAVSCLQTCAGGEPAPEPVAGDLDAGMPVDDAIMPPDAQEPEMLPKDMTML